jgi:hypothetical protein
LTRAALAALLAVVVCGCGKDSNPAPKAPPVPRTPPSSFVGVVADDVYDGPPAYRDRTLARIRASGAGLIRQTFDWSAIETAPGKYDFSGLDRYVAAVAGQRLRLLPILFRPPRFRSSAPERGAKRGVYPPEHPEDLGRFAAALVHRYGPQGDFWREHGDLPALPIRDWQVWNEPNFPFYWPSGPDPAAYVRLLRATGGAIHSVDPGAKVVSAGLASSHQGVPFDRFVEGMYAHGAKEALDVFALHPYAVDVPGVVNAADHTRELLAHLGHAPPIWVTELGWATGGPSSPFTVDETEQAGRVRRALGELARKRRALGLLGVVYFNWRDLPAPRGGGDFFGFHTGLLREDGSAKPALEAFREAARRIQR